MAVVGFDLEVEAAEGREAEGELEIRASEPRDRSETDLELGGDDVEAFVPVAAVLSDKLCVPVLQTGPDFATPRFCGHGELAPTREGSSRVDELGVDPFAEEEGVGVGGAAQGDTGEVGEGFVVELRPQDRVLVTQETVLAEVHVAMEGVWVGYPGGVRGC